ncbi:hypothetical protein RD792_010173, partial [Penstemon davidsonii]
MMNLYKAQHHGEEHFYDFHVVYSASYKVPVLYFRAYCSDGQPLVLDEIEKDIPVNSAQLLARSKWTFITQESCCPFPSVFALLVQIGRETPTTILLTPPPKDTQRGKERKKAQADIQEHPKLNRPWYTLHPCGTSEWMKLLLCKEDAVPVAQCKIIPVEKYLVSWFSVVGQ